jgi:hypothetical protein
LERKGDTPVAESMNKDPGTQAAVGHRDGAGDSGDDTMRFAQLSEDGDGSGAGAGGSSDDDHNATRIGLQLRTLWVSEKPSKDLATGYADVPATDMPISKPIKRAPMNDVN